MLTKTIQQFPALEPFIPFTLSLSSRTTLRIARASMAKVSESGDVLHVFDTDGNETSLISIRHVVSLTSDPPADEPVVSK
jgi:hypothetical protein